MQVIKQEIITTTTFFKMDPETKQLVVVADDSEATVVNIIRADKNGKILRSTWGELA